jgi:hypothetical protein
MNVQLTATPAIAFTGLSCVVKYFSPASRTFTGALTSFSLTPSASSTNSLIIKYMNLKNVLDGADSWVTTEVFRLVVICPTLGTASSETAVTV